MSDNVIIRPAFLEDVPHILQLGKEIIFTVPYFAILNLDADEAIMNINFLTTYEHGIVLVAVEGKQIVGATFGQLSEYWCSKDKYSTNMALFVSEKYRNKKIGLDLLKAFEEISFRKGAKSIDFPLGFSNCTYPKMSKLLKRSGYESVAEVYEKTLCTNH